MNSMIDKNHIKTILKINGIAPTAPNEEIRTILLSAQFSNDEVETALTVLRENVDTNETRIEGLHKVFRSDKGLKSGEISALLGIDVNIQSAHIATADNKSFAVIYYIILWALSVAIALIAIILYMHANEFGLFHQTSAVKIL